MTDKTYPPSADFVAKAHITADRYRDMYAASVSDPEGFWSTHGKRVDWIRPYTRVKNTSFKPGNVDIKWFEDGTLNVSANCIDRHLGTRADQVAIIWEPDDPNEPAQHITYAQLLEQTSRMANVLKDMGVGKGDRVVIYWRGQGRPRCDLPPDGAGSRLCHAGLHADRGHPLHRIRRLLAGRAGRTDQWL